MTSEQQQVRKWMKAFGQETPEKPTVPSLEVRKLRAKIKLEECLETIAALGIGVEIRIAINDSDSNFVLLNDLDFDKDFFFAAYGEPKLKDIADGCEDLKVVTEGTLVACGLLQTVDRADDENDPLFNEVMRSNWSKMWNDDTDPHNPELTYTLVKTHPEVDISIYVARDKDGKVIKSPSYSPANLQPIIDSLAKSS